MKQLDFEEENHPKDSFSSRILYRRKCRNSYHLESSGLVTAFQLKNALPNYHTQKSQYSHKMAPFSYKSGSSLENTITDE